MPEDTTSQSGTDSQTTTIQAMEATVDHALHTIEVAKAEAEAAAIKASLAEAESAFVPEAGGEEIALKTHQAEVATDKATTVEAATLPLVEAAQTIIAENNAEETSAE